MFYQCLVSLEPVVSLVIHVIYLFITLLGGELLSCVLAIYLWLGFFFLLPFWFFCLLLVPLKHPFSNLRLMTLVFFSSADRDMAWSYSVIFPSTCLLCRNLRTCTGQGSSTYPFKTPLHHNNCPSDTACTWQIPCFLMRGTFWRYLKLCCCTSLLVPYRFNSLYWGTCWTSKCMN